MTTQRRWIAGAIAEAAGCRVCPPWKRGLRRTALIARRRAAERTLSAPRLRRAC